MRLNAVSNAVCAQRTRIVTSSRDDLPHSRRYADANPNDGVRERCCDELPQSYSAGECSAIPEVRGRRLRRFAARARRGSISELRRSAAAVCRSWCEGASAFHARRLTPLKKLMVAVVSIERERWRTQRHRCCVSRTAMSGEVAFARRYYATHWKNCARRPSRSTPGALLRRSILPLACRTPQISIEI